MWNEQLNLPIPPLDTVAPPEVSFWATTIFSSLALLVFLYGFKHWRDTGRPIIFVMMVGGLTTVLVEPFLDVIGGAWHPEIGQNTAFALFGRAIPIWCLAVYVFYFGALGSLNLLAFEKGPTMKAVWIWFAAPMAIDVVMEEIMMHWDLYYYYGNQPLILLFKFPFWWAPCNSIGEFLGISLIATMTPWMKGWRLLLIPMILPIFDAIGYMAVGLPSLFVVNQQDVPNSIMQTAGVATFVLTAMVVYGISLLIAIDSPLRQRAAGRPLLPHLRPATI